MTQPVSAPIPELIPPSMQDRTTSLISWIALGLALFGLILAILPVGSFLAWLFTLPAFVLSIVGLTRKDGKKLVPAIALGASVVAFLIAVVVSIASLASIPTGQLSPPSTGVNQSNLPVAPSDEPESHAPAGTRENPLPVGSTVVLDEWEVTIGAPTFGATRAVLDENMFNPDPDEGNEYALVPVIAKYTGTGSETFALQVTISYVTASGVTYDAPLLLVVPGALDIGQELYTGGSTSGNIGLEIPSSDVGNGLIRVKGLFSRGAEMFVAVH